jgi:hypothetical protein
MLPSFRIKSSFNSIVIIKRIILFFIFNFLTFIGFGQMRQLYIDADGDNDIRKISLYSISEGYVAFTKWIGYTTDSGRTFIHKNITAGNVDFNGYSVNLTFGFGISGVKAFNKDTLLVYGNYGFVPAILYSVNQGNNFKLIYQSQLNNGRLTDGVTDLVFPENNNVGFAIEADRIIKTYDKGKSWVTIRSEPNSYFERISYVDNNTLYVHNKESSAPKLLKTTNSGSTWASISFPMNGWVNAVSFINSSNGWLNMSNADDNITYYTGNGGVTWRSMTNPAAASFKFVEMKFVNDKMGYALNGGYTVLKTLDSGKVWQPLLRDNGFTYLGYGHSHLFTIGNANVWAGGMYGLLELSTNGGGEPTPKAFFTVDTSNYITTRTIKLQNLSNPDYGFKWFVNDNFVSNSFNANYNHDITSFRDKVMLVVTNKGISDTTIKHVDFPVLKFPSITSFSPTTAGSGSQVVINGSNFTGITSVKFGSTAAASFSVVSDNMILAIVNNGATGEVSIQNVYSSATSPGFTFTAGPLSPPPVITNVTPAYGDIGTAITISGNNFSPVAAQNLVYFGTIKAIVIAASSTEINCVVPSGAIYSNISVLNVSTSLKGVSPKPFSVTFADSTNFTGSSFRVVQSIPWGPSSGYNFDYANVGDLDGDGKIDLIGGADYNKNLLHVYLNNSNGKDITFSPRQYVPIKAAKNIRDVVDIDGDGRPDILNVDGSNLNIVRNISTPGNLAFENNLVIVNPLQSGVLGLALDDLDGDGRTDIAIAGSSNRTMSVLRNTSWPGLISFSPGLGYTYPTNSPASLVHIAIADMDRDGKKDIMVLNFMHEHDCSISFFKNNSTQGNISFANKIDFDLKGGATAFNTLLLRDYDGDGVPDVTICNVDYLQVLINTSSGGSFSLAAPVYLAAGGNQSGALLANLTGGVRPDLATGNTHSERFSFFRNISTPGLIKNDPTANLADHGVSTSYQTAVADFNGDARPDIVGSSSNRGIVVIENSVGLPKDFKVCIGSGVSLIADIGGQIYQWQEDKGTGFVNIADNISFQGSNTGTLAIKAMPTSWNNYKYRCIVDGFNSCIYQLKMAGAVKPKVNITTPSLEFCKNGPVAYTAISQNDGGKPYYYWQINESTVSSGSLIDQANIFKTSILKNNDRVRVIVQSSEMCSVSQKDTSEILVMVEHGLIPAVSITGPSMTMCNGQPVSFVATPVNGGASPSYQWRQDGVIVGGNNSVLTTPVYNPTEIRVIMTSNSTECNIAGNVSSSLRPVVYDNFTNSVSIQSSWDPCENQPMAFSANFTRETNLIYEWQIDGITVGTRDNYYSANGLKNGSVIKLYKTVSRPCTTPVTAESNTIILQTIPNTVPSVSITGNNVVVEGQSTVLNAIPINGGNAPQYQWEDSISTSGWRLLGAETSNPALTFKPAIAGHKVRVTMQSNASCVSISKVTSSAQVFKFQAVTAVNSVPADEYGLTYFPNPATTVLTVDKLKISDLWETLQIVNIEGKQEMIVSARNKNRLDVPVVQLSQGFYIAILRGKSGSVVYMKFLKM